jgi:hypothetical protein
MHYRISCPNGHTVQASPDLEGRQAVCPICEVKFTVHVPSEALPPDIPKAKLEYPNSRSSSETPPPQTAHSQPAQTTNSAARGGSVDVPPIKTKRRSSWDGAAETDEAASAVTDVFSGSLVLMLGRALLLSGLVLVLLSKGCETTGARAGARARAKIDLVKSRFDYEWDEKLQPLTNRLKDIGDQIDEAEDPAPLHEASDNVTEEISDLQEQREKAERDLLGDMNKDFYKASRIASKNSVNAYWLEWIFILATTLLAVGLCLTAWNGVGPERWICFAVLLIIIYSLYVGGAAWDSSPAFDPSEIMPGGYLDI